MTHLSRETLVLWRDQPTDASRSEVVHHLAECNECAALYAELMRTRPADLAPQRFDPADFVARGRAVRAPAAPSARTRPWVLVSFAAAAVFIAAVFISRGPSIQEPPATRGAAGVQLLAPVGAVDKITEFTWSASDGANTFRVEILDPSGRVLHEARVTGRRFALPAELMASLKAGVEYTWMVSRLDARGETLESSPLVGFRISR